MNSIVKILGSVVIIALFAAIGIYFYQHAIPEAKRQATLNEMIIECVDYNSFPIKIMQNPRKVQAYLKTIKQTYPDITFGYSNAIDPSKENQISKLPPELLTPLRTCINDLNKNLSKY